MWVLMIHLQMHTLLGAAGMYAVSKTALVGLTKALAGELGPLGIRVNCIAPGTLHH